MRLVELFLVETSEEERAIISLSTSIFQLLQQYADTDIDYDDEDQEIIKVGKIGQLFNTPIHALNDVKLYIQSDSALKIRMDKEARAAGEKPSEDSPGGIWLGDSNSLILNSDYLSADEMKSTITHELRHALDDVKSNYATSTSPMYNTAKNKSYRKITKDPHMGNVAYLARPAEINGRFSQVLHDMVGHIARATEPNAKVGKNFVMQQFKLALEKHNIAHLFPEKYNSPEYKRLIKRGVDFINKEMEHAKTKNQPK